MRRQSGIAVASLGVLLAIARPGPARAEDPTNPAASDTSAKQLPEISGQVRSIDPATHTLHLKNSLKTLRLTDDTKVVKDGQETSILKINEGDEVRAAYSGYGDEVTVRRLEVLPRGK